MEKYWLGTLQNSEHAESVREKLRRGELAEGPWDTQPGTIEEAWSYLTPSSQFHCDWQNGHAARGPVFIPLTRIDGQLWRGPQPDLETLRTLQRQGLNTVFNLRPECHDSAGLCRQLGLTYHYLPVQDMSVPELPQVYGFLEQFADPRTVALVHCFAGQGRTGLFTAAYRVFRGYTPEQAIWETNQETGRKGMRPCQNRWILENSSCILSR
ncbi:MAG: dual specificity protein phosphatase family protein [Candidatus Eremiobacteraeota bacterium]|nr:dual specificity protein phosphatase family protein [Candidatus Eremiobacteraeota bacterium]